MIEDCKNALHEIEEIVVTVLNWFGIDNVRYNVKSYYADNHVGWGIEFYIKPNDNQQQVISFDKSAKRHYYHWNSDSYVDSKDELLELLIENNG